MALSRNAKRRLALYGGAAALAALILGGPRLISRFSAPVKARNLVAETDAGMNREAVKLLVEFLRIDTSNPPGATREAIRWLADRFDCEGIPYEVVGDEPARPILVARIRGASRDGALLLMNHVDVVPPGDPSGWDRPPFAGERGLRDHRHYLYGRGTLDMKGQTVAGFLAMAELARHAILPRRDVVFIAESGEESYEMSLGVGWVLEHRPDLLAGVTDSVNEGGVNEVLASDIGRYGIEVLQKGIVSLWIDAPSTESLEAFRTFIEKKDRELPDRMTPTVREFLRFIAPSRSDVWGRYMLASDEAATMKPSPAETPEVYRSLLRDAIYCGRPAPRPGGGYTMRVVWTLLPGSPPRAARDQLAAWAAGQGLSVRDHVVTEEAVASAAEGRAWETLETVLRLDAVEPAPVGIYVLNGAYTTSTVLRARGMRAFGFSPFNVNIHDASKIHGVNERIGVPQYLEGVERMRRFVFEYALAP